MTRLTALLKREWLLAIRSWKSLIMTLGMPVGFFLLFSATNDVSDLPVAVQNHIFKQVLMMMTISSVLSLVFYNLPYLLQEDRMRNRVRAILHTPVTYWEYYLVKTLRLLFFFGISISVVFTVGYVVKDIQMSLVEWVMSVVLILLGTFLMLPLGILLGQIKSSETLSLFSNLCYMGLAILGGLWYPMESFPAWLQKVTKLTPTHHFLNLLVSYYDKDFSWRSLAILAGYGIILLGMIALIKKRQDVY
ncbi:MULTISPECIES: ABC transporter permease [Streptococcus]|uniref:ABC transporter permease n=1 Tax=Streptococcus caledonicus TaxID=2614158 RepID=A0ABW0UAC8_9STRE|nr:ABC transporter permease [Streptococcus sp. S784/96/1]